MIGCRASSGRRTVYRFDVVGVLYGAGEPEVVHIENAFQVR